MCGVQDTSLLLNPMRTQTTPPTTRASPRKSNSRMWSLKGRLACGWRFSDINKTAIAMPPKGLRGQSDTQTDQGGKYSHKLMKKILEKHGSVWNIMHEYFRCAHHLQLALSAKTPPTKGPTILSAEISRNAPQQTLPPPRYRPRDPPRRSHISVVHRSAGECMTFW